jgi:hypothetical protein
MTKVTERVLDLETRLTLTPPGTEAERAQFEVLRPSEPPGIAQPPPAGYGWTPPGGASIPTPTAQPAQRARRPPRPRARRRISKAVILALVAVMILAMGMVAVALVTLQNPPSTTQTSCTMTAGGASCGIGGSLYVTRLDVTSTPYSGSYVVIIVLTVENNGSNPVTMNSLQFDSATLNNGPQSGGGIGSGLWSSSSNPMANGATSQVIINMPAASPSSLNGTHVITMVDSSGTSYTLSITISLQ